MDEAGHQRIRLRTTLHPLMEKRGAGETGSSRPAGRGHGATAMPFGPPAAERLISERDHARIGSGKHHANKGTRASPTGSHACNDTHRNKRRNCVAIKFD
jgi:hypothetical protein